MYMYMYVYVYVYVYAYVFIINCSISIFFTRDLHFLKGNRKSDHIAVSKMANL